ncbi:MAG: DUF4190 domain-containing protein [Clostridia bacterium]|nr:DUF4190 domain-containing protein [Clostridia bacterium]
MNCPNCNTFNVDTATFCASCGMKFAENQQTKAKEPVSNTRRTYYKPQPVGEKYSSKAIASLILSLVGILIAGIICGVIGIVLGILALVDIGRKPNVKGYVIAILGLSISVFDCVLMIISFTM